MIADYNVTAYETVKLDTIDFEVLIDLGTPSLKHIERVLDESGAGKVVGENAEWAYKVIIEENAERDGFAYFSIPGKVR